MLVEVQPEPAPPLVVPLRMISAARGHFSESHPDCSGPVEQSVPLGQESPFVPEYPQNVLDYLLMILMAFVA